MEGNIVLSHIYIDIAIFYIKIHKYGSTDEWSWLRGYFLTSRKSLALIISNNVYALN